MLRLMPASIALVYAHPYPNHSRVGRRLLAAVHRLDGLEVRSLYARYPDFAIDVAAEQRALLAAELIVWQHPTYWYGVPSLLALWFEKVLARGWAYGQGGVALRDKTCLWVVTTGGDADAYRAGGMHGRPFSEFVAPIEQTARFCGMHWAPPLIMHGAHHLSENELDAHCRAYRERLLSFTPPVNPPKPEPRQADGEGIES
jgi:glutathione-regulated potassium-efflux system ancillary protein KefF